VYQIYPRSFQDSNGDGIGDLNGITSRLDYIKELGVDVIWLCPIYESPNDDNGYDISDYRAIHPEFGTMEDFDRLLAEVHSRNMRLIMDLVVNHTSDEHTWFKNSQKDPDGPFGNFYIWQSGCGDSPPNNWGSWFGGSAWEQDITTGRYYLHIFSRKQPDLNWQNEVVRQEVYDMMRWWLNKGVDGFRMDVINLISKPDNLPDGPLIGEYGDLSPFCVNGSKVHDYLQEMHRNVLCQYDCMTVGETPDVTVEEARLYAGFEQNELNMVFQFEHTGLSNGPYGKWSNIETPLPALKAVFNKWQTGLHGWAWNSLYWGNHDQPRAVSKFGDDRPKYRTLSAKMLATCLYLMQGTPYIFQGEELGMTNAGFTRLDEYKDIETLNAYHDLASKGVVSHKEMMEYIGRVGRDNARTPMQWENAAQAGFTTGSPWIKVNSNYGQINAAQQMGDAGSILRYYQKLLQFRKQNAIIRDGNFELLYPEHPTLFAYRRSSELETLTVICNFSNRKVELPFTTSKGSRVVLNNYDGIEQFHGLMRPYESCVLWEQTMKG